jgi:two-component system, NarL family, response regulator DegU
LPREPLTPREIAVLGCIAEGLTNRKAAERLGLTTRTVANYAERATHKLGVPHRTAAVVVALQLGLLDLATLHVTDPTADVVQRTSSSGTVP